MKCIIKISFLVFIFNYQNIVANNKFTNFQDYETTKTKFNLKEITKGINYPWGMTFINEKDLLITEKNGKLIKVNTKSGEKIEIKHNIQSIGYNSSFFGSGQGGLLDVLYNDNFIYFTYSHNHKNKEDQKINKNSSTTIARGKLFGNEIKDLEILLISKPELKISDFRSARGTPRRTFPIKDGLDWKSPTKVWDPEIEARGAAWLFLKEL